jgi:hypothetical protein
MSLTAKEIKEKIDIINADIDNMRSAMGNERKISMLIDYIDYLKDELKEAERAERLNKGA